MNARQLPHLPTFKRLVAQLGSRYALSYHTMAAFALPALGAGFVFEQSRFEQDPVDRIVFVIVGYIATVVPLLIARRFLPDEPRPSKPLATASVFVLAGLVRGLSVAGLGVVYQTGQLADNVYRIAGAPLFTLVMLSVCTILVSNYRRHREALVQLAKERAALRARSEGILAKINSQREELISEVRAILDPEIAKIRERLSSKSGRAGTVIEALRSTVEDVVRPLTKDVLEAADSLKVETNQKLGKEAAELPDRIVLGEFFLPVIGAIVTTAALIPAVFWIEPPYGAVTILAVTFASLLLVLSAARKIFAKTLVSPFLAAAVVPVIYGLSLLTFYLHKVLPFFTSHATDTEINAAILFSAVMGATFFYSQLVQLQRVKTIEKIIATNQELEKLNSWLRGELWLNRRRTASVLHGPIQAALYASAMKLSQVEVPTDELIAEVENDIQEAIGQLDQRPSTEEFNISEVFKQIQEVWSDAALIEFNLTEFLEQAISQSSQAREAVVEVVREFVNNAIRHGKAATVEVTISRLDNDRIGIRVVDDGFGPAPDTTAGFGSKLMDELTLTWSLERSDDTTVGSAEIVTGRDSL